MRIKMNNGAPHYTLIKPGRLCTITGAPALEYADMRPKARSAVFTSAFSAPAVGEGPC